MQFDDSFGGRTLVYLSQFLKEQRPLTLIILFCLSISLGAGLAILNTALRAISPPVPAASRSYWLQLSHAGGGIGLNPRQVTSLQAETKIFDAVGAYVAPGRRGQPDYVSLDGKKLFVQTAQVTPSLFPMLGSTAQVGRLPNSADTRFPYDFFDSAVLSWSTWTRVYHQDPNIVGKVISFHGSPYPNGTDLRVVGVLAKDVVFPVRADLFIPMPSENDRRIPAHSLHTLLTLRKGTSVESATKRIGEIAAAEGWMDVFASPQTSLTLKPFLPGLLGSLGRFLSITSLAALSVFGLVVLNLVLLALMTYETRKQNLAIVYAFGASPLSLARRMIPGTLLFGSIFAVLALISSYIISRILLARMALFAPSYIHATTSYMTVILVVAISFCGIALWSYAPLLIAWRTGQRANLSTGRSSSATKLSARLLTSLCGLGVFLTSAVLLSSIVSLYTFHSQRASFGGFDLDNLYEATCVIPNDAGHTYTGNGILLGTLERALASTFHSQAALSIYMPSEPGPLESPIALTSSPTQVNVNLEGVSPFFFRTMGLSLLRGRDYSESDMTDMSSSGPQPMIIDETVMRRLSLREDNVIGSFIHSPGSKDTARVIGVVSAVGSSQEPVPTIYVPVPDLLHSNTDLTFHIFIRSPLSTADVSQQMRDVIKRFLPQAEPSELVSAENLFPLDYQLLRMEAAFSMLAVIITAMVAGIGVFSMVAWVIAGNYKSIAIRVCLGASRWQALTSVLSALLATSGVAILGGLGLSSIIMRLGGVSPHFASWSIAIAFIVLLLILTSTIAIALARKRLSDRALLLTINA
jgi:putative ABC transport system permease protein